MEMSKLTKIVGGSLILVSVALAIWVHPWWLLLATVVGAGQVQAAFTGWCPLETLLKKFGVKGSCCSIPQKDQPEQKDQCCSGH